MAGPVTDATFNITRLRDIQNWAANMAELNIMDTHIALLKVLNEFWHSMKDEAKECLNLQNALDWITVLNLIRICIWMRNTDWWSCFQFRFIIFSVPKAIHNPNYLNSITNVVSDLICMNSDSLIIITTILSLYKGKNATKRDVSQIWNEQCPCKGRVVPFNASLDSLFSSWWKDTTLGLSCRYIAWNIRRA